MLYWERRCYTVDGSTLVTIYNPTLLFLGVLVLGPYQHLLEGTGLHLSQTSPIQAHRQLTGQQLSHNSFNILGRECQDLIRLIKESIYIRVNNPTLNRNIGKFQLNHIWDRVLFSTLKLKTAFPQGNAQHSPYQLYKLQHLGFSSDLMKSSCGWMKACLCQFKSFVWRNFIMIPELLFTLLMELGSYEAYILT